MSWQGNILVITSWSFKDALVQAYTLPYLKIIRKIIPSSKKILLVTDEQSRIALTTDELDNINRQWEKDNMQLIALPYRRFGLKKILAWPGRVLKLYRLVKKEKVNVIHAFCTPAGSIGYLLSVLSGRPLIIDSYEPHAEAMVENGTWKKNGLAYRILFTLEKKQTKKAGLLIATTDGMKDYAKRKYGVSINNFFVKPACVDLELFFAGEKDKALLHELDLLDKIVCVYAGKLGGIYYKDEVFAFIKSCYEYWGEKFRFLMLSNASQEEINAGIEKAGLPAGTVISRFVFHHDVPRYLSLGDFALNPVKPVPTKRYCTSIKDGEYWAMGLPVVISPGISDDTAIVEKEKTGVVIDFTNVKSFKSAILTIEQMISGNANLKSRIRETARKYRSFEIARQIYSRVYGENS